jgi:hypothetical protein
MRTGRSEDAMPFAVAFPCAAPRSHKSIVAMHNVIPSSPCHPLISEKSSFNSKGDRAKLLVPLQNQLSKLLCGIQ